MSNTKTDLGRTIGTIDLIKIGSSQIPGLFRDGEQQFLYSVQLYDSEPVPVLAPCGMGAISQATCMQHEKEAPWTAKQRVAGHDFKQLEWDDVCSASITLCLSDDEAVEKFPSAVKKQGDVYYVVDKNGIPVANVRRVPFIMRGWSGIAF